MTQEKINKVTDDMFEFTRVDELASEKIDAPIYSYWRSVFRKFFSSKLTVFMLALMAIIVLLSFIQPLFSGYNFMNTGNINNFAARYNPPSLKYWFGTDANGQSLFDAVWAGARTSILIGFLATVITTVLGVIVGAIWGNSPRIDRFMLELYNVVSNVPALLIVMVLSFSFGNGFWNLLFAMSATSWLGVAYFIRVQVMIIRDREYNLASRTLGTKTWHIVTKNTLPFMVSVIMTMASTSLPGFIGYEVFLSFLGIGLSADTPSLGRMIAQYSNNMTNDAYLFWIPVIVLALVTMTLYLVGQALADASDPKTHL
ncbi:oligopeptide ABC transporter permease OppC [Lactococcus nasutitermitis]|uniref:Oligopeptide ABC transporter permease OppC n=1 Tax=Lactococcus nasutitermitis TaxID=1652957 RepID=A0ABV9JCE8_9LACT|nr:oligopeptide ABC transporter permease OppC [Lactococcus nasutitermitis]